MFNNAMLSGFELYPHWVPLQEYKIFPTLSLVRAAEPTASWQENVIAIVILPWVLARML